MQIELHNYFLKYLSFSKYIKLAKGKKKLFVLEIINNILLIFKTLKLFKLKLKLIMV